MTSWISLTSWPVVALVVIFCTLLLDYIVRRCVKGMAQQAQKTRNIIDDLIIAAIGKPLSLLIYILGFSFALEIIAQNIDLTVVSGHVKAVRLLGVVAAFIWFFSRQISIAELSIKVGDLKPAGKQLDFTTVDAVAKLLRISTYITGALIILQSLGYSIAGVLAFGGVGGIAVGFAAKDMLANFFGGLLIYLDRPFNVGDWVRSPDRKIEGEVEKIGWRLTIIRTFDKRPLYVPNSLFNNIVLENPQRMTHRRIYEVIGIRYVDAQRMSVITSAIKQMLKEHPEIDTTRTLIVNFDKFAPSSLDFFVYALTKTTNWIQFHEIKEDVLLKIMGIIEKNGAECAFPHTTLHVPDPISIEDRRIAGNLGE
ncbi:MAG: mechanosensitive ion channel family protein [Candidatus Eutrophobiaceae bacterium]